MREATCARTPTSKVPTEGWTSGSSILCYYQDEPDASSSDENVVTDNTGEDEDSANRFGNLQC